MRSAQGQGEAFAGALQPLLVLCAQCAMAAQAGEIEEGVGAALARLLDPACTRHLGGDRCAVLAAGRRRVERSGFAGDGQVQVDAVEQRAREFAAVALDLVRRAAAAPTGIAEIAARAGIHCRHQLEARGETHAVPGTGDHDMATFQGLP